MMVRRQLLYKRQKNETKNEENQFSETSRDRSNLTLKEMLNKQRGVSKTPRDRLRNALLTLNFLKINEQKPKAAERHSLDYRKN